MSLKMFGVPVRAHRLTTVKALCWGWKGGGKGGDKAGDRAGSATLKEATGEWGQDEDSGCVVCSGPATPSLPSPQQVQATPILSP